MRNDSRIGMALCTIMGVVFLCSDVSVLANKALCLRTASQPSSQSKGGDKNTVSTTTQPAPTSQPDQSKIIVGLVFYNPTQYIYRKHKQLRAFPRAIYHICEEFRNVRIIKFVNEYRFGDFVKKLKKRKPNQKCYLLQIAVTDIYSGFWTCSLDAEITVKDENLQVIYQRYAGGSFDRDRGYTERYHTSYRRPSVILNRGYGKGVGKAERYSRHYRYTREHFCRKKPVRFKDIYAAVMLAMYKITGDKKTLWEFEEQYREAAEIAKAEYKTIEPINMKQTDKSATTQPDIYQYKGIIIKWND